MKYMAKYRGPGIFRRWRRFKNVTGDGFVDGQPVRFFVLDDGSMVHFPSHCEVYFAPERDRVVREKINRETGQQVSV